MSTETEPSESRTASSHHTAHGELVFGGRCLIMGVLNVTPDSFSDGGRYLDAVAAADHARRMADDGADVIDLGGESTRPGSPPVPEDEQLRRVLPALHALRAAGVSIPVSIDTRSARVAAEALNAGADIVNDISGARADPDMPGLLADRKPPFIIMHMTGTPETMQQAPRYGDVVTEVRAFFNQRADALTAAGVDCGRMIVDPGIGFGKTTDHNLALLRSLDAVRGPWPLLLGTSRKRFLGEILNEPDPQRRLMGTAAAAAHSILSGADLIRVHDVREIRQLADVLFAIRRTTPTDPSRSTSPTNPIRGSS